MLLFYLSKHLLFDSYSLDLFNLTLWASAALVGGAALGAAGSCIGKQGWLGVGATALVIGLLLGDAYRRAHDYGVDVAAALDMIAALSILDYHSYNSRSLRQGLAVIGVTIPMTVVGYVLIVLPNWLQQILLERL